jgi:hypothetical protein
MDDDYFNEEKGNAELGNVFYSLFVIHIFSYTVRYLVISSDVTLPCANTKCTVGAQGFSYNYGNMI